MKVQEYNIYKDLMREVRMLEMDINGYQQELRRNIQTNQMHEYIQIGNEHLQEFYKQWERKFNQYEEESIDKIQEMRGIHDLQMDKLEEKLGRAVEAAKIKPTLKLKDMQTSEKLVAVNERVEEA